nr:hypothetical protein [Sinobaca sp. H24]
MKKALLLTMTVGMAAGLAACGGETEEGQEQENAEEENTSRRKDIL